MARPEFDRAAGLVAVPERHLARLARRRRDQHAVVRDLLDPPGGRAERERLADLRLEDHLLVQLAHAHGPVGAGEEDAVQTAVGNGAGVGDGHALGAFASCDGVVDAVPRDARPQLRELVRRVAARQHVEHAFEHAAAQIGEGRRAADEGEQLVDVPGVERRHRHDLLRQDVERVSRIARRFHHPVVHRPGHGRGGDEVAAELRKDDPFADRADLVARAADPLQPAGDRRRRFDLHDQIDRAHVDAELQRRGGHQRLDAAGLQQVLDLAARRACQRPVMRPHQRLARQLVQRARQPLGQPAAVHEQQRRPVRANQLEQPRMDGRPDRRPDRPLRCRAARRARSGAAEPRHVFDRHLDPQRQLFLFRGVDDGDGPVGGGLLFLGELVVELGFDLVERNARRAFASAVPASPCAGAWPAGAPFGAPRNRATSSSGRCVAERPMRCKRRRSRPGAPAPPAVRATARGARRVCRGRARGSRR